MVIGVDEWTQTPPPGDGVEHDEGCVDPDIEGLMCGCLECVNCGAQTICLGCVKADFAGL